MINIRGYRINPAHIVSYYRSMETVVTIDTIDGKVRNIGFTSLEKATRLITWLDGKVKIQELDVFKEF